MTRSFLVSGRFLEPSLQPFFQETSDAVGHELEHEDQDDAKYQHVVVLIFPEQEREDGGEGGREHNAPYRANAANRKDDDEPDRQLQRERARRDVSDEMRKQAARQGARNAREHEDFRLEPDGIDAQNGGRFFARLDGLQRSSDPRVHQVLGEDEASDSHPPRQIMVTARRGELQASNREGGNAVDTGWAARDVEIFDNQNVKDLAERQRSYGEIVSLQP